uniref:Uncharacterized protein n=1 Tax=Rhizophora mucronata TaxID=61149 RepID=A0A2P2PPU6_RHIMU
MQFSKELTCNIYIDSRDHNVYKIFLHVASPCQTATI